MGYLIQSDFRRQIQSDNLNQIIGGDTSILTTALAVAQEEAITHLIQKYDVATEFTDTLPWNRGSVYKAGARVYLDANPYSASSNYSTGDLVLQAGSVYFCNVAISVPEPFTPSKWTLLGKQYEIFYAKQPASLFDLLAFYPANTQVYWKGKVYTSIRDTLRYDHSTLLQFESTENIPYQNYFPDDTINSGKQWNSGTSYQVDAGTLPTDSSKWIMGDNRSQALVMYIVDIALYHVHSRIAPKNIPDLRVKRYDDAISSLKGYAKGNTTANLTKIQPPQGKRIRWGSNIKNTNSY